MSESRIRNRLVRRGKKLFDAPRELIRFTRVEKADRLLNDLTKHPHAFVLGCIMDRQVKAEKAWLIPYLFKEKLGSLSMRTLSALTCAHVRQLMTKPEALHRFPTDMADYFYAAVQRIKERYGRDASLIWKGEPASATVVYRFLEFEGVGPKIASMAANILAREFKVPLSDYFSIDISADVHIRRVFGRLGLMPPNATVEQLIFRARALHPTFPGLMDLPTWEIGRNWCKPRIPECHRCPMNDLCPTAHEGKM